MNTFNRAVDRLRVVGLHLGNVLVLHSNRRRHRLERARGQAALPDPHRSMR